MDIEAEEVINTIIIIAITTRIDQGNIITIRDMGTPEINKIQISPSVTAAIPVRIKEVVEDSTFKEVVPRST